MIDTHIHLDDRQYDGIREEIISSFAADNIDFAINASCDATTMREGFALANKYPDIFCTVGLHPHDADKWNVDFAADMAQLASYEKTVAVGEIGLDYYYDNSDRQTQREVFDAQIVLADSLGLPLMLHIRDAFADCLDILHSRRNYLNNGVLLHCFSGSAEIAAQLARYDAYFAFGGAITFKKNRKDAVIASIPVDRILTETDGPYLSPEPLRGKVNQPKNISLVLIRMSEILQKSVQETERLVYGNAMRFFPKIKAFYAKNPKVTE